MYNKTGKEIKSFAKFMAFCEIDFWVILAIFMIWFSWNEPIPMHPILCLVMFVGAFVVGIFGILFSWLKYLFIAGYGELIDNTDKSFSELKVVSSELKDINKVLAKQLNSPGDNS